MKVSARVIIRWSTRLVCASVPRDVGSNRGHAKRYPALSDSSGCTHRKRPEIKRNPAISPYCRIFAWDGGQADLGLCSAPCHLFPRYVLTSLPAPRRATHAVADRDVQHASGPAPPSRYTCTSAGRCAGKALRALTLTARNSRACLPFKAR
jgi:hypothetical protein